MHRKRKEKTMKSKESEPDFLDVVDHQANREDRKVVIMRYATHNFMELKPEFVKDVVKEARSRVMQAYTGIDKLTPLERLGLLVLQDASKMFTP
jgi:hypothetical protein